LILKYLLDNDVFLAAIYKGHEAHKVAREWLDSHKDAGWGIAAETFLATMRLLMNPTIMGSGALSAPDTIAAIETELSGKHPGKVVLATHKPDTSLFQKAVGHRQIMEIWLLQIAREHHCKLATRDGGTLANWPADTIAIANL
jgi:predicted nucleic acid-binding protein